MAALIASEHHGVVTANGVPVPGATVTATQGDKKLVTTTDDRGAYSFPNLADGTWTIQVDMLGFGSLTKEVAVAPDAPSPTWDLKVLSLNALRQQLAPQAQAASPAAPAATTAPAQPKPGSNRCRGCECSATFAGRRPAGRGAQGAATWHYG